MFGFETPNAQKFFIAGKWVDPIDPQGSAIIRNPNTGDKLAELTLGGKGDVNRAVEAAEGAFVSWSRTSPSERADLLEAIADALETRREAVADTICQEMGCPRHLTDRFHVAMGIEIWRKTAKLVREFDWSRQQGNAEIVHEAIGPVAILTPWNGPITSVAKKTAVALGTGCTAISKPSEITPFSAIHIAEVIEEVGAPSGIFNMVQGLGDPVGEALAGHLGIAGLTLTGSVNAGIAVSRAGAFNLKRMCLELGGKSANIILDDDRFSEGVKNGTIMNMLNTGQVCFAPSRMLVPENRLAEAEAIAKAVADGLSVGHAETPGAMIGPLVSEAQKARVLSYINIGIEEGARLIAGGPENPEGLNQGYFVRPTVFSGVDSAMRIAQEEIFGPVLSIIAYKDDEDAISIANNTPFGLAAHISGTDQAKVRQIAGRMRAGSVYLNGAMMNFDAPFGGYKISGQGREHGNMGMMEFLETKAIITPA